MTPLERPPEPDRPVAPGDPTGPAARPVSSLRLPRRGVTLSEVTVDGGLWHRLQQTNASATLDHCHHWLERLGWLVNFDHVAVDPAASPHTGAGPRTAADGTAPDTGTSRPGHAGWVFADSEVYKLIEALAWEHARTGDPGVDRRLRQLVARIAPAQDDDGYLNTCFGHPGQPDRWSDLAHGHELYCAGHLIQAGVARLRSPHRAGSPAPVADPGPTGSTGLVGPTGSTGLVGPTGSTGLVGPAGSAGAPGQEDELVAIARRVADQVCEEFGPNGPGRDGIGGHPGIEVALVELGRATGERRYLDQARRFVERRGHGRLHPPPLRGPDYFQDDVPVREAGVWRGHAVRALYLAAGAVDVAVETGDDELLAAVGRQWERSVERRTHLTGGMGSRHQDEGFGEDWELPPDRAYCETCAGVASIMVSWRLYLATGEVRYPDLIERTLYNVVATSPSADGRAFFYANPLHQRVEGEALSADGVNRRAEGGTRAPWFEVSCCPTNVARLLASWPAYAASVEGDTVSLLQYAPGTVTVDLDEPSGGDGPGGRLGLRVDTGYPFDGDIGIEVTEAPRRPVTLRLRVPHWADGATLTGVDGRSIGSAPATGDGATAGDDAGRGDRERPVAPGWAEVTAELSPGDRVTLHLPVGPRWTWPDPRIDALRGTVAVERGPLVLCLEGTDLPPGVDLSDVTVTVDPAVAPFTDGYGARAAGLTPTPTPAPAPTPTPTTDGSAAGFGDGDRPAMGGTPPYHPTPSEPRPRSELDLRLVPYFTWAERGPSTMRVWLPVATT